MNKLIISGPFGKYFNCPGVTSTVGTYTYRNTSSVKMAWRALTTVWYYGRLQSWINRLGLPNPDVNKLNRRDVCDKILSIYGYNEQEWEALASLASLLEPLRVELNLSCPNITKTAIREAIRAAEIARCLLGGIVIAKLPPIRWMDFARPLMSVGVNKFHLCNTIPSPGGGLSGKVLKQYSLWAVEEVKQIWGEEVTIIGGGGITEIADIDDYIKAGADHVSVGSMLFNPFNWKKLEVFKNHLGI